MYKPKSLIGVGAMLCLTLIFGAILSAPKVNADTSGLIDIVVNVPSACTLTPSNTSLTKTISPGTSDTIGVANLKAVCNDPAGFAIYTAGFTDEEFGKNVLSTALTTDAQHNYDIETGTGTSTSNWNMTIKNATTTGNYTATIENDFDEAHEVPDAYTKVATVASVTDQTIGTNLTAQFDAYIAPDQPASTYTGKVIFTLVHPATADAPEPPRYMQNIASWRDDISVGQEIHVIDKRDGKEYTAIKLPSGALFMTQNLDFDIDATKTYTSADTDLPEGATWTPARSTYTEATATWCASGSGGHGECSTNYTPESYDPGDVYWDGEVSDSSDTGAPVQSGDPHYHAGNYYNFAAASAMNNISELASGTVIDQSICPAGWTIPRADVGNNSFYDAIDSLVELGFDITTGNLWESPLHIIASGGTEGTGFIDNWFFGRFGFYRTSLYYEYDSEIFRLNAPAMSYGSDPGATSSNGIGYSVRCVERQEQVYVMQDVSQWGSEISSGQEVTVVDSRDGKRYTAARFADGNLWMTQNLDHDIDIDFEYTNENTDIGWNSSTYSYDTASWTPSHSTSTVWQNPFNSDGSYNPGDIYWNGTTDDNGAWDAYYDSYNGNSYDESLNPTTSFVADAGDSHYHIGNYYNWYAAVVKNDDSGITNDRQIIDQSICPSGWALPLLDNNLDKSFYQLLDQYGLSTSSINILNATVWGSPLYLAVSGSSFGGVGQEAFFWTSSVSRPDSYTLGAFALYFDINGNIALNSYGRDAGFSVRCVARHGLQASY